VLNASSSSFFVFSDAQQLEQESDRKLSVINLKAELGRSKKHRLCQIAIFCGAGRRLGANASFSV
jgi:hypothetical protein